MRLRGRIAKSRLFLALGVVGTLIAAEAVGAAAQSSGTAPQPVFIGTGQVTTFAGGGNQDGEAATRARLGLNFFGRPDVHGLTVDASGSVLAATGSPTYSGRTPGDIGFDRIRRIDAASDAIASAAGSATSGFSGDGGPATAAQLALPMDVKLDGSGNEFILDSANQRVRKVAAGSGIITTVAGGGKGNVPGFTGDGGPATQAVLALFSDVSDFNQYELAGGIALDGAGNLFISDEGNQRVRRVDSGTGIITTVAGGGSPADGLGDGGPARSAALAGPHDVTVDSAGNLYIADYNYFLQSGSRVRKVDARTGIITTVAGGGSPADGVGDGGPATSAALVPGCVELDPAGNLIICDLTGRVRKVDLGTGLITTIGGGGAPADGVGDGGAATTAALSPQGVAFDAAGFMYISDGHQDRVRRVNPSSGIIRTIAGGPNNIGDGGPAAKAQVFSTGGVAAFRHTTYISEGDPFGSTGVRLRKVSSKGIITTLAGGANPADGLGDGGPATNAALQGTGKVAVDDAGNVYVVDVDRIRRVDVRTGVITTFAGGGTPATGTGDGGPATTAALTSPTGVFVVGEGNAKWRPGTAFITECNPDPSAGGRVREVDPSGVISTVAGNGTAGFAGDGGPAAAAPLGCATDVTVDGAGNLLIADAGNSRIRRVDASGVLMTIAGDGDFGLAGVGGPALSAHLNTPRGLLLDPAGNLLIADAYMRVLKIGADGILSLVAGTGVPGFGGDGGPAIYANLFRVAQIGFDSSGSLLIADQGNLRVRRIDPAVPTPNSGCGQVITHDTTLTSDLGPCRGEGIIVGADHITLNLNGHRVVGVGQDGQHAGILVSGRRDVTVIGGQVDHFSGGIVLVNSTRTTVRNTTIRDNVGTYDQYGYGDGVLFYYSSHNTIVNNNIIGNGIYDNVGVFGRLSDYNLFRANTIRDNVSIDQGGIFGIGENMHSNAFADQSLPDRGASLVGNQIIDNKVLRAYANGISNLSNTQARIVGNTVDGTGEAYPDFGVGIGVQHLLQATPLTQDLVKNNRVYNSPAFGIQMQASGNRIISNTATGNGSFGGYDLNDTEADCPNTWFDNTYATAEPACTITGGHQVPDASAALSSRTATGPATSARIPANQPRSVPSHRSAPDG